MIHVPKGNRIINYSQPYIILTSKTPRDARPATPIVGETCNTHCRRIIPKTLLNVEALMSIQSVSQAKDPYFRLERTYTSRLPVRLNPICGCQCFWHCTLQLKGFQNLSVWV